MGRFPRIAASVFVAAVAAGALGVAGPANASGAVEPSTITVTGTGAARGVPDVMVVYLTIRHRERKPAAALAADKAAVAQVRESLAADGVAPRDVTTGDFDLRNSSSKKAGPGYTASQIMSATLRDLDAAGRVITNARRAAGGESTFDDARYAIEDTSTLERTARRAAFADARTKAEQYAEADGRMLGAVRSIQEAEPSSYGYGYGARTPAAQTVSIRTVTVWELA